MNRQDCNFGASVLAAFLFLSGCASDEQIAAAASARALALEGLVAPDFYLVTPDGVEVGAADIDPGAAVDLNRTKKLFVPGGEVIDRLGRALYGDDFDPNKIIAPDYNVPIYKSGINKQLLLDELMSSAYDAYEEVTGNKWYPRRTITGVPSRDPLLNPYWWQVYAGQTLQSTLAKWGRRAGWRVVWKSDHEYPLEANAVFIGNFPKVVHRVLASFDAKLSPVHAVFYKNRVLVIESGEEGDGQ